MTLRKNIFSVLILLLLISITSVWFVLRPLYEKTLIDDRITLVSQYQHYGIIQAESLLSLWIKTASALEEDVTANPKLIERTINLLMGINPDIISIKITDVKSGEELLAENNQQQKLNLTIDNLDFYSIPSNKKFQFSWVSTLNGEIAYWILKSEITVQGQQFISYFIFNANAIVKEILQIPIDGSNYSSLSGYGKILLSKNRELQPDSSLILAKTQNLTTVTEAIINNQICSILRSELELLGLSLTYVVSNDVIREPLNQITSYSLIFIVVIFFILTIVGWYLSDQLIHPVADVLKSLKPIETLSFDTAIPSAKQIEFKAITDSLEIIRKKMYDYQKLNVDLIIREEWKNKFLMNYSDSFIAITDEGGNFTFLNYRFKELLGMLNVQLESITRDVLLHDYIFMSHQKVIREQHEGIYRIVITQSDGTVNLPSGETQFLKLQEITIYSETQIVFSLLMFHDLTQEHLVEKAKNDMMNIIVHEFRTPLASILGFSEVVLTELDLTLEERKTFVGNIIKGGKKLEQLINRFLDIQKLESGHIAINKVYVNVETIINDLIVMLHPQSEQKEIEFKVIKESEIPEVPGVPELLAEAFQNLMSNAIKYGENKRVIEIFLKSSNTSFVFRIRDYGWGISDEDQAKLFTKFYRVKSNINSYKQVGTGLGLAYTKEIVLRHGGEIKLISNPNIGSEFTITLPLKL